MAYLTVTELKAALADAGGAGSRTAASLPDPRLQENIAEAQGEVVGRLAVDFGLPDPGEPDVAAPGEIPGLLKTIMVGIAGYLATLEFYGSQPVEDRDPVVLRYARARELLAMISGGKLEVAGIVPKAGGSASGDPAIYQGPPAVGLAEEFAPGHGNVSSPAYFGGVTWE